jgi:hypothetical protein
MKAGQNNKYDILTSNFPFLRKLSRLLDMTSIGDWLMLYMLAKNIDQVTFTELVNELKYPDYRFDLDERDSINEELDKLQFQPKNTKK